MAFITPLVPYKSIEEIAAEKSNTAKVSGQSFESALRDAVNGGKELENKSNSDAYDLAVGKTDDLTSVMLSSVKAQTAVQTATQITTRAVNTYREIMQMNI